MGQQPRQSFPLVAATNVDAWCVCMSVRVCACVHPTAVENRNTFSRGEVQFQRFLFFSFATACCCVPVSHRKLFTLWQPWDNSSRTSFSDRYERCFCVCVRVFIPQQ